MSDKKRRRPAPIKPQLIISRDDEREMLAQLRERFGSDGAVLRAGLRLLYAQEFPQDTTGAILGWHAPRTALIAAECAYCDQAIQAGQQYAAADTVGDVGGMFAHIGCIEEMLED